MSNKVMLTDDVKREILEWLSKTHVHMKGLTIKNKHAPEKSEIEIHALPSGQTGFWLNGSGHCVAINTVPRKTSEDDDSVIHDRISIELYSGFRNTPSLALIISDEGLQLQASKDDADAPKVLDLNKVLEAINA